MASEDRSRAEEVPSSLSAQETQKQNLRNNVKSDLRTAQYSVAIDGIIDDAWELFAESVSAFALALARETARLELTSRDIEETDPQVTSTMVRQALRKLQQPVAESPKPVPKWIYGIRISAFVSTLTTGVIGAYLHSTLQWVAFAIIGLIALATNVFVIFGRTP